MTWLNILFRRWGRQPSRKLLAARFRPGAELLEARDVPSVGTPDIALVKTAGATCYAPGATATYTYVVTNPVGLQQVNNVPLTNVSLIDDNGTPSNPSDDFTLIPGVNVVATDDNGTPNNPSDDFTVAAGATLAVGHSWTFTKAVTLPMVSVDAMITNTATVTATGVVGGAPGTAMATATATVEICVPPPPTTPLVQGDTATIGFWHNKNGQALIDSLNGGPGSTNLTNWLSTNFPDLYGTNAGSTNLTGKTNADVAALFLKDFSVKGMKTDAQILGAALAVYVTDSSLAGNAAVPYGFNVTASGTGSATYNVGSNGTAIGLMNNTSYTVFALLEDADLQQRNGTFNAGAFNTIFDGINSGGDI